jgi:glycerol-3-phosphate dehydrogenase
MDEIARFFPNARRAWTDRASLPGGDIPGGDVDRFARDLLARKPFLLPVVARRLARSYGTRVDRFLKHAKSTTDLGRNFGMGLTEAEIEYLATAEWAATAEDILWRRSKLGLHLPGTVALEIDCYLKGRRQPSKTTVQP